MKRKAIPLIFIILISLLATPTTKANYGITVISIYPSSEWNQRRQIEDHHPSDSASRSDYAQSINISQTTYITAFTLSLDTTGAPTGNAYGLIYSTTGTHGLDAIPTGTPLGISRPVDVSTIGGVQTDVSFNFTTPVTLPPGIYCIVYQNPTVGNINGANDVRIYVNNTGLDDPGNGAEYVNGAWTNETTVDMCYILYGATAATYGYSFTDTYYENGTIYVPPVNVSVIGNGYSDEFNTSGGSYQVYTPEPTAFSWGIGGGYTRYIYSFGSENFTITYPENTFYAYGFTVKDYTGKLGLGTAYLEAYRTINGTETLIERMKISQPNAVPLNLVFGRTYHLKVLFADGSRYDWGYFLTGSDTTNTIIIRSTEFTDQAHMIYNIIQVEARRSADGTTITVDYNDTQEDTTWANITIQRRGAGTIFTASRNNDTFTLNWASANPDYGYIVSINGLHGDFGEWGYVWIFDETETFPDVPSLDGIWDWGLGANLGGWLIVMVATLGFSKALKARALIVGIALATLTNYIGFSSWTGNQLIFGWVFAVIVAIAGGGAE